MLAKILLMVAALLVVVSCGTDDEKPFALHGGFASISDARSAVVLVPDSQLVQYAAWALELNIWLSNPVKTAAVSTEVLNQAIGESEYFLWVVANAGKLPVDTPSDNALDAAVWVAESYISADDALVVNDDGSIYSRSEILDNLKTVLTSLGRVTSDNEPLVFSPAVISESCNPLVQECTQYAVPDANYSTTNFTQGVAAGDGDADWFDEIDEGIFGGSDDGSTRWTSPSNPVSECISTEIGDPTDPFLSGSHAVKSRDSKGGGKTVDLTVDLLEAGVLVGGNTFASIGTGYTTRTYTLSVGEADGISDYTDLQIRTCVNAVGGGSPSETNITAQELEVPDLVRRSFSVTSD